MVHIYNYYDNILFIYILALQYMNLDWAENFNLVEIGEVRKIDQLVADDKVEEVFSKMGSSLASAIAKVALTRKKLPWWNRAICSDRLRCGLGSTGTSRYPWKPAYPTRRRESPRKWSWWTIISSFRCFSTALSLRMCSTPWLRMCCKSKKESVSSFSGNLWLGCKQHGQERMQFNWTC